MALITNRKLLSVVGILVYIIACVEISNKIVRTHDTTKQIQTQLPKEVKKTPMVLVNERIESYIKRANPKLTEQQVRKIANLSIIESGGNIEKLSLIIALFQVESNFDHTKQSEKYAYGIGQLTHSATDEYRLTTGKVLNPRKLKDNIKLVVWTLENNKRKYIKADNAQLNLITYNGGLKQLRKAQKGERLCKETREYVIRVLNNQTKVKGELS